MKKIILYLLLFAVITANAQSVSMSSLVTKGSIAGTEKIAVSGAGNPAITPNLLKSWLAGTTALTATGPKTSSYTAVAFDLIATDATSGTVPITLPTTPADKTMVAVKMVTTSGTNTTTITTGGSDVYNKTGGATVLTLSILNQGVVLQYRATGGIWYAVADDLSLAQLDLRYMPDFAVLTYGATVTWATGNLLSPKATLTATGNFTIDMTSVRSGSIGVLKLTTNTASAITMTFDSDFTNASVNGTFSTFPFPALTGKDYFLSYVAVGTVLEWSIVIANAINDPGGSNDDILQMKSGVWVNRTLTQVRTDLAPMFTMTIGHAIDAALVLTNAANAEQCVPNNNSIHIFYFDATNYRQARIDARVATASTVSPNNPRLYLQYSTNGGSVWNTVGGGTIASGDVIALTVAGFIKSNWIDLPGGGKGDYLWRVAQNGGNAVDDPAVGNIHVTFRM